MLGPTHSASNKKVSESSHKPSRKKKKLFLFVASVMPGGRKDNSWRDDGNTKCGDGKAKGKRERERERERERDRERERERGEKKWNISL